MNERDPWYPLRGMFVPSDRRTCSRPGRHSRSSGRRPSPQRPRSPRTALHESVDGEFSFVQTMRHLVFAMDKWFTVPILGETFHPIGLPNTGSLDFPWPGLEDSLAPSLTDVLAVRADRADSLPRLPRDD